MKKLKFAVALSALLGASALAVPVKDNVLQGAIVDLPVDLKGAEVRLMSWFNDFTAGTAPIDDQGNFSLTLTDLSKNPDQLIKVSELLGKKTVIGDVCEGQGKATPDTGSFQMFSLVVWADGKPYGDITLDKSASYLVNKDAAEANLMYFSGPTSLSGGVKCPPPYDNSNFKGQYPAGWSLARAELSSTPAGAWIYSYDPMAPVTGLSWRMFKEYGSVGMQIDYSIGKITRVVAGQAAEKAGLKVGDVIVSVDGKPLLESGGLRGEPDSKVVLVVRRDDKEMTFDVTRSLARNP